MISDWLSAKHRLQKWLDDRCVFPALVRELPGETFHDPSGWRFAVTYFHDATGLPERHSVVRVGPRGGITHLATFTVNQWAYLQGVW